MAAILKELGQYTEAEALTRKSIDLNPSIHQAYLNLGLIIIEKAKILEDTSKYQEAKNYILKQWLTTLEMFFCDS